MKTLSLARCVSVIALFLGLSVSAQTDQVAMDKDTQNMLDPSQKSQWLAIRESRDRLLLYDRVSVHSFERRNRRRGEMPQRMIEDRGYEYYTYPSYRRPDDEPCENCQNQNSE